MKRQNIEVWFFVGCEHETFNATLFVVFATIDVEPVDIDQPIRRKVLILVDVAVLEPRLIPPLKAHCAIRNAMPAVFMK